MKLPLLLTPGKILAETQEPLYLEESHLARHSFIAGGTGNGKSKLLELQMRQLIDYGQGFTFVDPHGDTAKALVEYCALRKVDPARVVYLEPSPNRCFTIDPFDNPPRDVSADAFDCWLMARVDRTFDAFIRHMPAGERELVKRLKRWFRNVAYVCGFDADGWHAGLHKALALTNPENPDFERIVERVRPHVVTDFGREILMDLDVLKNTRGQRQREAWVESTINLLRDVMSPLVRLIFEPRGTTLDQRRIAQNHCFQIVNVAKTDWLSREQGSVIGGLIINSVLNDAENTPERERVLHFLNIDEAERFIGEELRMAFKEMRKYKRPVTLAVQNLKSLLKGDLDLMSEVISQCKLQMSFHQGDPEDIDYLSKAFLYGSLDFTPLLSIQVLPDGYKFVTTQSISVSESSGQTRSAAETLTKTHSQTKQTHSARSIQKSVSLAMSETETEGESSTYGRSRSQGVSAARNWSDSHGESLQLSRSDSKGRTDTISQSHTDGNSFQQSKTKTEGESHGDTASQSEGESDQKTSGEQSSESRSHATNTGSSRSASAGKSRPHNAAGGTVQEGKSRSDSRGESDSTGQTKGTTNSESHSKTQSKTTGRNDSTNRSESEGETRGENSSDTDGSSVGVTKTRTDGVSVGQNRNRSDGGSVTQSAQDGTSESHGTNRGRSRGLTRGQSIGEGETHGSSAGESHGTSIGQQRGESSSRGSSLSTSFNMTPLAQHRFLVVDQGKYQRSVPDQLAYVMNILGSLPDRMLLVKVKGMGFPFVMRVHEVLDPYVQKKLLRCPEWRADDVRRFLAKVYAAHPFYFVPDQTPRRTPMFLEPGAPDIFPLHRHEETPNDDEDGAGEAVLA